MGWLTPTKKVSDVATYVKRQFGDESGVQITDDDVIRWINSGQAEIANANGLLQASANKTLVVGTNNYALGVDMPIESIRSLHVANIKLQYMNFNDYEKYVTDEDPTGTRTGKPEVWSEWGGQVLLYPVPDSAYAMTVYYRAAPALVATVNDLLSLPDKYLQRIIDYVMAQAFELDENFNAHEAKLDRLDSKLVSMSGDEDKGSTDTYHKITIMEDDL